MGNFLLETTFSHKGLLID